MAAQIPTPTPEEIEEVLLAARYGEAEDAAALKEFADKYGWPAVTDARDERGNSALHMACGNGHIDIVKLLVPHATAAFLSATNEAGSPALHWAIMNNHTAVVQALVDLPEEQGGGIQLLKEKNAAGRDAFMEAVFAGEGKEEVAGWIEGYLWKIEGGDEEEDAPAEVTEAVAPKDDAESDAVHEVTVKAGDLSVADGAQPAAEADAGAKTKPNADA